MRPHHARRREDLAEQEERGPSSGRAKLADTQAHSYAPNETDGGAACHASVRPPLAHIGRNSQRSNTLPCTGAGGCFGSAPLVAVFLSRSVGIRRLGSHFRGLLQVSGTFALTCGCLPAFFPPVVRLRFQEGGAAGVSRWWGWSGSEVWFRRHPQCVAFGSGSWLLQTMRVLEGSATIRV